jgi:predicted transcriptional regulator
MSSAEFDIGAAELEVLKVLWDHGACTVRQVHGHLQARGRRLAYTTVLTFLTRLDGKGHVTSDRSSVAYVYRAALSRRRFTRSRLRAVIEQLYDGAAGPMVLQLVRNEKLSSEDIAELAAWIEKLDAGSQTGPRGRRNEA